jgi:hypothetical protein
LGLFEGYVTPVGILRQMGEMDDDVCEFGKLLSVNEF